MITPFEGRSSPREAAGMFVGKHRTGWVSGERNALRRNAGGDHELPGERSCPDTLLPREQCSSCPHIPAMSPARCAHNRTTRTSPIALTPALGAIDANNRSTRGLRPELTHTAQATTPLDLLTKIGRGAEKRLGAQAESWDKLNGVWMKGGEGIRDSGLSVKDRRYVSHELEVKTDIQQFGYGHRIFGRSGKERQVADL